MKLIYVLLLHYFAMSIGMAQAITLNDSIPQGKNYDTAAFQLWYPNGIFTIAGVLVLLPGSNGDGRIMVEDTIWQNLARRNKFALLGCYFTDRPHKNIDIEEYVNVKEGSGDALLLILTRFAEKSGHAELSKIPLLFWGFSAGGEFNYEFACWKPERVIAFIVNKGGIYYTALASEETQNVPAIFFVGQKDLEFRTNVVKGIFTANRRFGALWTFVEEPDLGHAIGKSQQMAALFFNEIIPLRLPKKGQQQNNEILLQRLSENSGFIGNLKTLKYEEYATCQKQGYPTSWFVNAKVANAWMLLTKGQPLE
jgi:dienelactone hydrolase